MDIFTQTLENIPAEDKAVDTRNICIKLWKEFCAHKVTGEELRKEISYTAISIEHGWNELRRKPLPTRPAKLVNYLRIAEELIRTKQYEKKFRLQEKTFQDMRIADYIKQFSRVQAENMKILNWLRQLKDIFEKDGDMGSKGKVQRRIEEFLSEGGEIDYRKSY